MPLELQESRRLLGGCRCFTRLQMFSETEILAQFVEVERLWFVSNLLVVS